MLLESVDGLENHKAESLFKQFKKALGDIQNWSPELVQRKLNLKSKNIFKTKQKRLRGTDDMIKEENFKQVLANGSSFLCCIETKNISARDNENETDVLQFLDYTYKDQFIWCVGRFHPNPKRLAVTSYSPEFIEIPDLNFGHDRRNQLVALCPIKDIIMAIVLEDNYGASILFDNRFLKTVCHRSKQIVKPINSTYFKTQKTSNNDKENRDPRQAGPSGLCSNSSKSNASKTNSNKDTENNCQNQSELSGTGVQNQSEPSGTDVQKQSEPSGLDIQNLNRIRETVSSTKSTEKKISRDESSDDEVLCDIDDSRQIVFKKTHAEITSKGVTQKIEIASRTDYPELVSQVGYQIENDNLWL